MQKIGRTTAAVIEDQKSIVKYLVVPKLGLNRHFPNAVLYRPLKMGGLNFPQFKTVQATRSIMYMMKQLRWNKEIATEIRINIEMTQLMSGRERTIMEDVAPPIKYIPDTWITTVRERLKKMKAEMSIENIWHPMKQRKNDISIMEKI